MATRNYPKELVDRGARLAIESGRPVSHVAAELGLPAETLRKKVSQAEADRGSRSETLTAGLYSARICAPIDT